MHNILFLTILLAGIETFALTSITQYSKNSKLIYILIGCFIYGCIIPFLILKLLNFEGIGMVNLFSNIITTVTMIIIGYYIFNEKINNLHLISCTFAVLSVIIFYFASIQ